MLGKELSAMMGAAPAAKPAAGAIPVEEEYGAGSVREEADMAAAEFQRNPTAETFMALKTLCEELEQAQGYEDDEPPEA